MMKMTRIGTVLILCWALLSGCAQTTPMPGSTHLKVRFNAQECSPSAWRVPAGEAIQMDLENLTDQDVSWILMERPVTPPFDGQDALNVLFAVTVPAGRQEKAVFTAPLAAGDYDVVCSRLPHSAEDYPGRLTVVQP